MKPNPEEIALPRDFITDLKRFITEAESIVAASHPDSASGSDGALHSRIADLQDRFSHLYTGARKRLVVGAKAADEVVHQYPYQSIAIAAGIGLLIGVFVGRRTD